ncbi:hypothetical protein Y032_0552g3336 [Ancylostoma ceylanicum]|nr:hypothetical protein Y032_0552g3336 [Ancylostoma ceylanicum]
MLLLKFLSFLALLASCSNAFKMVIFVPNIANSQVIFNSRVAETLAKAGHDVTMVMISALDGPETKFVKIAEKVRIYNVNASIGITRKNFLAQQEAFMFEDLPMWDYRMRATMSRMSSLFVGSCRKILENKEFLEWLAAEKFELAFSYVGNLCPVGLIHHAKIPAWIWLNSAALMDFVAHYMGVPRIPSYVPPIVMESTDHMNFLERTKSLVGHIITIPVWKW